MTGSKVPGIHIAGKSHISMVTLNAKLLMKNLLPGEGQLPSLL